MLVVGRPRDPALHLPRRPGPRRLSRGVRRRRRARPAPAGHRAGAGGDDSPRGPAARRAVRRAPRRVQPDRRAPAASEPRRGAGGGVVPRAVGAVVRVALVVLRLAVPQHVLREGGRRRGARLRRDHAQQWRVLRRTLARAGRPGARAAVEDERAVTRRVAAGDRRPGRAAATGRAVRAGHDERAPRRGVPALRRRRRRRLHGPAPLHHAGVRPDRALDRARRRQPRSPGRAVGAVEDRHRGRDRRRRGGAGRLRAPPARPDAREPPPRQLQERSRHRHAGVPARVHPRSRADRQGPGAVRAQG